MEVEEYSQLTQGASVRRMAPSLRLPQLAAWVSLFRTWLSRNKKRPRVSP